MALSAHGMNGCLNGGQTACLGRIRLLHDAPEMKVERVSYDAMTPSAARGILEAIHWKPAIRCGDRPHSCLETNPFRKPAPQRVGAQNTAGQRPESYESGATDDLHILIEKDRQQRATTLLRNVAYVIEAHFVLTDAAKAEDTEAKHLAMVQPSRCQGAVFSPALSGYPRVRGRLCAGG